MLLFSTTGIATYPRQPRNAYVENALQDENGASYSLKQKSPTYRRATTIETLMIVFFGDIVFLFLWFGAAVLSYMIGGILSAAIVFAVIPFVLFAKGYPQRAFGLKFVDEQENDLSVMMLFVRQIVSYIFTFTIFLQLANLAGISNKDDPRLMTDRFLGIYLVSLYPEEG